MVLRPREGKGQARSTGKQGDSSHFSMGQRVPNPQIALLDCGSRRPQERRAGWGAGVDQVGRRSSVEQTDQNSPGPCFSVLSLCHLGQMHLLGEGQGICPKASMYPVSTEVGGTCD